MNPPRKTVHPALVGTVEVYEPILYDAQTLRRLGAQARAAVYIRKFRHDHTGEYPKLESVMAAASVGQGTAYRALVAAGQKRRKERKPPV